MGLRLVVGLGNPGAQYERTRHNVGFRVLDRLAPEADASWRDFRGLGQVGRVGDLWLGKPETFMNDSGRFVRAFADYHGVSPAETLLVCDEIAIPLGRLRVRLKGSAGGQKGLVSVIQHLGTEEFPRLRVGIGPQPERMDAADFVLGRFTKTEEATLDEVLTRAADAVRVCVEAGLAEAMNRYNPSTA